MFIVSIVPLLFAGNYAKAVGKYEGFIESGNITEATAHCLQKKKEFSDLKEKLLNEIDHVEKFQKSHPTISDSNLKNDLTAAAQVLQKKETFWETRMLNPNHLNYYSLNKRLTKFSVTDKKDFIIDYAQNIELYAQIMLAFCTLEEKGYVFQSIERSQFKESIPIVNESWV